LNTTEILQILLFYKNNLKKKSPSAKAKGLGMSWLPLPYWSASELLRRV